MRGENARHEPSLGRRPVLKALGGASAVGLTARTVSARQGEQITLEYVDVAGTRSAETFQPVLDQLNEEYDAEIRLEFNEIPFENMLQQLLTRVGGGNAPDVAALDQVWLGNFVGGGNLLSLNEVADEIEFDDYIDAFAEPVQQDGNVFALPITTDVRGMYWNRGLFEEAGLDPESPPETWEELFDTAEQLHDPPETFGLTHFVNGGRWTVDLFSAGGEVLSEDATEPRFQEEPGVRAAGFIDTLHNERDVSPPEPIFQNGAQMAREFLQGQHAINVVEGSWLDFFWQNLDNDPAEMPEQFGFAPTPHPADGQTATMSGGFTWAAFESTDNPEVARDFLRIAGGREFKRQLAAAEGDIPTRESLQDVDEIWDQILYADTIRSMLQNTNTRPISNWSVVASSLDPALQRVAFDRAEPEEALQSAAEEVRNEIGG